MKMIVLAATALGLSGCSPPLPATLGLDPAEASAAVPAPRYAPVAAGTVDHGPVDPAPWVDQNRGVAPPGAE
jgi:hypothetical protein